MNIVLVALITLFSGLADARETLPFLNIVRDSEQIDLGPYLTVFSDFEHKLGIKDIAAPGFQPNFKPARFNVPNWGLDHAGCWAKFTLVNSTSEPIRILLEHRFAPTDFLSLYYPKSDGSFGEKKQGDHVAFKERDIKFHYPIFAVDLAPGSSTFYFELSTTGASILPVFIWTPGKFEAYQQIQCAILGILFGVLAAMACYNVFLFLTMRTLGYFYYVGYIISCIFYLLAFQGVGQQLFEADRIYSYFSNEGFVLSDNGIVIFANLFAINFLNMKEQMRPVYRYLIALIGCSVLALVFLALDNYQVAVKLSNLVSFLTAISLLLAGLWSSWRGYRPAYFYTLGWCIWLGAAVVFTLATAGFSGYHVASFDYMFFGQAIEAILLSIALGDKVNYLRKKWETAIIDFNTELKNHAEKVEALVAERTETIRMITDNIKPGFLMIDSQLQVMPGFTQSCKKLICNNIQSGVAVMEFFNFDARTKDHVESAIIQIFADTLPDQVGLAQLPQRLKSKLCLLQVEGSVIRDEHRAIRYLLLSVTDAGPLYEKEREAEQNRMFLWIVKHQLAFCLFVSNSLEKLASIKTKNIGFDSAQMRAILHTIKGNSASFFMLDLANLIHEIESRPSIGMVELVEIERYLDNFLTSHQDILGEITDANIKNTCSIDKNALDQFWIDLEKENSIVGVKKLVKHWMEEAMSIDINEYIGPLREEMMELAKRKGKKIELIEDHNNLKVPSKHGIFILEQLPHILRNAVDHGIEMLDERRMTHKEPTGKVRLKLRQQGDKLLIVISDDGRGIDGDKLLKKAAEKKLLDPDQLRSLSDKDKLELIFMDRLSSLDTATPSSGRGVGLSSVKSAVEALHGEISVSSQTGHGTEFEIKLPKAA